eukprot:SAG11_NODE_28000_length_326_cov_1.052863_1_plen_93_part_01
MLNSSISALLFVWRLLLLKVLLLRLLRLLPALLLLLLPIVLLLLTTHSHRHCRGGRSGSRGRDTRAWRWLPHSDPAGWRVPGAAKLCGRARTL